MKTKNHDPEPTQTDSGLYSEAKPPADEGPQRSTDAGDVKPYTDEELREAREHMARCADREFISVVEFRRLLATLDERDRRLAEAMPPRALREWREALGEYAPEDTGGWSPLVGATHAVVRDLDGAEKTLRCVAEIGALRGRLAAVERERDAEAHAASNHADFAERMLRSACDMRDALDSVAVHLGVDTNTDAETEARACVEAVAALCEEVERLQGERDAYKRDLQGELDGKAAMRERFGAREGETMWSWVERLAAAEADLVNMAGQRDAAERRAEEAADLLRGGVSLAHDLRQRAYGDPKMSGTPPMVARSLAWEEAASSWLAALPSQEQTPAAPPTSTLDQSEGEPTVTVTIEEDDASSAAVHLGAARLRLEERARNTASDVCRYVFEAEAEALERVERALEVAVAASKESRAAHPSKGEEVGRG